MRRKPDDTRPSDETQFGKLLLPAASYRYRLIAIPSSLTSETNETESVNCSAFMPQARAPATFSSRSSMKKICSAEQPASLIARLVNPGIGLHTFDFVAEERISKSSFSTTETGRRHIPNGLHTYLTGCQSEIHGGPTGKMSGTIGRLRSKISPESAQQFVSIRCRTCFLRKSFEKLVRRNFARLVVGLQIFIKKVIVLSARR